MNDLEVPAGTDDFELAVKFLSNPKVFGLPDERKVEFLVNKGIPRSTVERALDATVVANNESTNARYCPFNKKVYPEGANNAGGGVLYFLWKFVRMTSGLALGAFLLKKFVWPIVADLIGFAKSRPSRHNSNEALVKKLDAIVSTLKDVVTRQEAVAESLALLLKTRQPGQAGAGSSSTGVDNERMLAEIADLKALLVSPNRFPPMPTTTFVPHSSKSKSLPQVARKSSNSTSSHGSSNTTENHSNKAPIDVPNNNNGETASDKRADSV